VTLLNEHEELFSILEDELNRLIDTVEMSYALAKAKEDRDHQVKKLQLKVIDGERTLG
jgi:hypothetical protein